MKQEGATPISASKETELAKKLVSDDAQERSDCLKEIENLIKNSKISETQFRRTWKALFYGLWNTDKVRIQLEVAMIIARMVHLFEPQAMISWLSAGFEIFHREWDKLDYWRTSKFLSLARFTLNEAYLYLENRGFQGKLVKQWNQVFYDSALGEKLQIKSTGLTLHVIQIFVESLLELNSPSYVVLKTLIDPFLQFLAESDDRNKKSKVVEFVFKFLIKNLQEGQFEEFNSQKYSAYLLKRASAKEVNNNKRKFLYNVQKEFLKYVSPENPLDANLDVEDNEELDEVYVKIAPSAKKTKVEVAKENKKNGKAAKKEAVKEEKKEEKPSKLNKKAQQKEEEKKTKATLNEKLEKSKKKNAKVIEQEEEEEDWEDEDIEDDDDEEEEEEEEIEEPKQKKGKTQSNKKDAKGKGKQETKVAVKNGKRGREAIEEEDDEDDEDFDEEEVSDEDGWEEDDFTEELMAKLHTEEEQEELEMLSSEGYMQLSKSGVLGKLPPYFFQTKKQKQVFFNKLNKSYYSKLEDQSARVLDHSRKVNFQLTKNTVKEFDKRVKVPEGKKNAKKESPGKSILKQKSSVISNKKKNNKPSNVAAKAVKQQKQQKPVDGPKKQGRKKVKI